MKYILSVVVIAIGISVVVKMDKFYEENNIESCKIYTGEEQEMCRTDLIYFIFNR